LIHGRPFPLRGSYYANIFIHFEPTGRPLNYEGENWEEELLDDFYPPYLIPDSPEVENWERNNPSGWREASPAGAAMDTISSMAHQAAAQNDLVELANVAAQDHEMLLSTDRNGWQPIHEAARAGHAEAVAFLVEHGADVNALTSPESGLTPLAIAVWANSKDHPVAQALLSLGGMGSDL
jgi:prolyl 4-hydroxylase